MIPIVFSLILYWSR